MTNAAAYSTSRWSLAYSYEYAEYLNGDPVRSTTSVDLTTPWRFS